MRTRYMLVAAASAAVVAVSGLTAFSAPAPKVTGGGQTDVGTSGAGDTIAFVAQSKPTTENANAARGQVQYIDREADVPQVVRHGTVTCLTIDGTTARLGGVWEDRDGGGTFEIQVMDNGEGDAAPDDMIGIYPMAINDCANTDGAEDDGTVALGRGNVQVH
jgi:hypothetical protein